jgi:hypothetical protein
LSAAHSTSRLFHSPSRRQFVLLKGFALGKTSKISVEVTLPPVHASLGVVSSDGTNPVPLFEIDDPTHKPLAITQIDSGSDVVNQQAHAYYAAVMLRVRWLLATSGALAVSLSGGAGNGQQHKIDTQKST